MSRPQPGALSWRVTLNSFALLAGSYFLGSHLLAFFGVSLPAVQVGGGLIVCAFGWNLLMEKDGEKNATPEAVESDDIFRKVFYPLTLPLTSGPGSISVAITVGANVGHTCGVHIWIMVASVLAMGLVAASIFFCYRFADWLVRVLGETGTTVVIRLSAFLLLCIGVQIVWNGADALLGSVRLQLK